MLMEANDAGKFEEVLCFSGATSSDICPPQVNSDLLWPKRQMKIKLYFCFTLSLKQNETFDF